MKYFCDLHIHSKYSRAVSPEMTIPNLAKWGKIKGIQVIGTGDFTHPFWFNDLKENLVEDGSGFLKYKGDVGDGVRFVLSAEISDIFTQGGKGRRIHSVILAPTFADVQKINDKLSKAGNLMSDGRPILPISAKQLLQTVKEASPRSIFIPAHIWTPWFSLYGANSGFNSLEECFGELQSEIFAVETGLSSDPAMNWRIKELDSRRIISCSDSHSLAKLGREATVIEGVLSFDGLAEALKGTSTTNKISYTVEFHPEEGKYHYTGHRDCKVRYTPEEVRKLGTICPVCGRPLTVGVMQRVEQLASRGEADLGLTIKGSVVSSANLKRPPYVMLVPLQEVLAEAIGAGTGTQKVQDEYQNIIRLFGSEFEVLLNATEARLAEWLQPRIVEGILKNRRGEVIVSPGYDGVFGVVSIWNENQPADETEATEQMPLFQ